jgi:hypothetical protein
MLSLSFAVALVGCAQQQRPGPLLTAPADLAAAMRRLSASRDTTELNSLIRSALYVRDAEFFEAALEVATKTNATAEARAVGFLVAAMETTDRTEFILAEILAADGPMIGCVGAHNDHSLRIAGGTPLPADAVPRLRSAIAGVLGASGEPILVRNAARCASVVVGVANSTR